MCKGYSEGQDKRKGQGQSEDHGYFLKNNINCQKREDEAECYGLTGSKYMDFESSLYSKNSIYINNYKVMIKFM